MIDVRTIWFDGFADFVRANARVEQLHQQTADKIRNLEKAEFVSFDFSSLFRGVAVLRSGRFSA